VFPAQFLIQIPDIGRIRFDHAVAHLVVQAINFIFIRNGKDMVPFLRVMDISVVGLVFGYTSYVNNNFGSVEDLMRLIASSPETGGMLSPVGVMPVPMLISLLVMFSFSSVALPHIVQGNLTYRDTRSLKHAIVIGGISALIVYFFLLSVGIVMKGIKPDLAVADYTMPYLSFLTLPAPLTGVMLSAVAASIQSTVAAMMLLVCATICNDLYKKMIRPEVSDQKMKTISRVVLVLLCVLVTVLSFNPPDAVQLLTNYAIGGLASGLFFPLLLGLFWKRANEYGAIVGTVVGFVYFVVGSNVPAICFGLNAFVPAVLASGISMILVSLVTPKPRLDTIQVWFCKNYDKEFSTGGRIKQ